MQQLFAAALAYPAVVLTVLVGVAFLYWLMVIFGGLDIDLAGGGDAGTGGGDIADLGDMGHGADAGHGGDAGHAGAGDAGGVMAALGLRAVPLTITISLLSLFGWILCISMTLALGDDGPAGGLPPWLLGSLVLVVALALALLPTSMIGRMLAPLFVTQQAKRRADYVGTVCTVTTGKVTATFGQARIEDGGDMLLVHVRCDTGARFARGDQALIIDYDQAREAYLLEPMDALLRQPTPNNRHAN